MERRCEIPGTVYVDADGNVLEPDAHAHRGDACGGGAYDVHRERGSADRQPVVVLPDDMQWTGREDGDEIALLFGDPSKTGPFVSPIRSGPTSRELPHHHPRAAYITVLSGEFRFGTGPEYRESSATLIRTGDVLRVGPELPHFKWNDVPSVVEVHATGPWGTAWSGR